MRAVACLIICCSMALAGAERAVIITGEVSDSQCAFNVHSSGSSHDDVIKTNILGHTPGERTRSCVRLGSKYVIVDSVHKKAYHVANPALVEAFAAKKVRVKAMLGGTDTLSITSVEPQ